MISERAIAVLEPRELEAIVAHEDAHASAYSDGWLAIYSSVLAGARLVGRNVLLSAFNFRECEFRADAYAAEKISASAMADAL